MIRIYLSCYSICICILVNCAVTVGFGCYFITIPLNFIRMFWPFFIVYPYQFVILVFEIKRSLIVFILHTHQVISLPFETDNHLSVSRKRFYPSFWHFTWGAGAVWIVVVSGCGVFHNWITRCNIFGCACSKSDCCEGHKAQCDFSHLSIVLLVKMSFSNGGQKKRGLSTLAYPASLAFALPVSLNKQCRSPRVLVYKKRMPNHGRCTLRYCGDRKRSCEVRDAADKRRYNVFFIMSCRSASGGVEAVWKTVARHSAPFRLRWKRRCKSTYFLQTDKIFLHIEGRMQGIVFVFSMLLEHLCHRHSGADGNGGLYLFSV